MPKNTYGKNIKYKISWPNGQHFFCSHLPYRLERDDIEWLDSMQIAVLVEKDDPVPETEKDERCRYEQRVKQQQKDYRRNMEIINSTHLRKKINTKTQKSQNDSDEDLEEQLESEILMIDGIKRLILTGGRGGKYWITDNGYKRYISMIDKDRISKIRKNGEVISYYSTDSDGLEDSDIDQESVSERSLSQPQQERICSLSRFFGDKDELENVSESVSDYVSESDEDEDDDDYMNDKYITLIDKMNKEFYHANDVWIEEQMKMSYVYIYKLQNSL